MTKKIDLILKTLKKLNSSAMNNTKIKITKNFVQMVAIVLLIPEPT